MRTRFVAAALAAIALVPLAGCRTEPSSSGAHGTVVGQDKGKRYISTPKPGRWERWYEVTVREDGGKRDTGSVSAKVYESCTVGKRWPDCKK